MGKSTSVKREIRFQQWIQQVKEYICNTLTKGSGQMPGIMSDIS